MSALTGMWTGLLMTSCVSKFFAVNAKVGEQMQAIGQASGAAGGAGGGGGGGLFG